MHTADGHELLTLREAADYLRVSQRTLHRHIASGRLEIVRAGDRLIRIRRSAVEALLQQR